MSQKSKMHRTHKSEADEGTVLCAIPTNAVPPLTGEPVLPAGRRLSRMRAGAVLPGAEIAFYGPKQRFSKNIRLCTQTLMCICKACQGGRASECRRDEPPAPQEGPARARHCERVPPIRQTLSRECDRSEPADAPS